MIQQEATTEKWKPEKPKATTGPQPDRGGGYGSWFPHGLSAVAASSLVARFSW